MTKPPSRSVEYGLEMKAGITPQQVVQTMQRLNSGIWQSSVFNAAQRGVSQLDSGLNLQKTLNPWLDVTQDRHKFIVKNEKTGVEVELSFDKVVAKTLRPEHANADGSPRTAEFYVLEAELDHLQLQSTNASTYAAAGAAAGGAFQTDAEQDKWLNTLSTNVTLDIDPRLHELDDLENKSFRSTASYTQFEDVSAKLLPALFPQGLGYGRQKAAHAAEVMDLIHFDDQGMLDAARDIVEGAGFKWTGEMRREFDATIKGANKRKLLQQMFVNGKAKTDPYAFVQAGAGNVVVTYDHANLKRRLANHLQSIGFATTPEIDNLVEKITMANVPPAKLQNLLQRIRGVPDANVMATLAQTVNVSPAPVPLPDVKALMVGMDTSIRTQMTHAWIDESVIPSLTSFMSEVCAKGALVVEMSGVLSGLQSKGQTRLDALGQKFGVTAPILKASPKAMLAYIEPKFSNTYYRSNKGFEDLLVAMANHYPLEEAIRRAQGFSTGTPQTMVEQQATALGVAAPKLSVNFDMLDQSVAASLGTQMIVYDAPLKDFVRAAVTSGTDITSVNTLMRSIPDLDLQSALTAKNISLPGVTIPTLSYDVAAAQKYVRSNNGYKNLLGTDFDDFVKEALAHGATPNNIHFYAATLMSVGRAAAEQKLGLSVEAIPKISIVDARALATDAASRNRGDWKPEYSAYIEKALPKAIELSSTFGPGHLTRANTAKILQVLEDASKLPKPV